MLPVLLLFMGLTGCSLVASLDDYEFQKQGTCDCKDSALACCDGCDFVEPGGQACAAAAELRCSQTGCGGAVERREGEQFCSGKSAACDGEISWGEWVTQKECGDFAQCRLEPNGADAACIGDLKCASWIQIDGDSFEMGSAFPKESPVHTVKVRSFEMLQAEVTVAQYRECANDSGCTPPVDEEGCNFLMADFDNHPMNCVSWEQAGEFCAWAGGRLPAEAEWEYAARSNGQKIDHPWGNEPASCERAVIAEDGDGCGTGNTFPVCSKPQGSTTTELCDMGGNLWEWVEDVWHENYTGAPEDGSPWLEPKHEDRAIRGGGLFSPGNDTKVTTREHEKSSSQLADVGFRCVRGSNPGEICSTDKDCRLDAICPNLGGNELESYCYIECEKDPQICAGTDYPLCSNVWNVHLCLAEITLKGSFECKVGTWVKGESKTTLGLASGGEQHGLDDCRASKTSDGKNWLIQLSKRIGNRQLDAIIYWAAYRHVVDTPIGIEEMGYLYDDTYDPQGNVIEESILGLFLEGSGQVQLTEAGSTAGQTISGTIELSGRAYKAKMTL